MGTCELGVPAWFFYRLCQPDCDWVVRKLGKRREEESREREEAKFTFAVRSVLTMCQALCWAGGSKRKT